MDTFSVLGHSYQCCARPHSVSSLGLRGVSPSAGSCSNLGGLTLNFPDGHVCGWGLVLSWPLGHLFSWKAVHGVCACFHQVCLVGDWEGLYVWPQGLHETHSCVPTLSLQPPPLSLCVPETGPCPSPSTAVAAPRVRETRVGQPGERTPRAQRTVWGQR